MLYSHAFIMCTLNKDTISKHMIVEQFLFPFLSVLFYKYKEIRRLEEQNPKAATASSESFSIHFAFQNAVLFTVLTERSHFKS